VEANKRRGPAGDVTLFLIGVDGVGGRLT